MGISHFCCTLSAWYRDGRPLLPERLGQDLGISEIPYPVNSSGEKGTAVRVDVGELALKDFGDPYENPEVYNDFGKAIETCLMKFADWLSTIPTEGMRRLREESFYGWVIVNLWIDSDQMDIHILPPLSRELGRLELELYILSNE